MAAVYRIVPSRDFAGWGGNALAALELGDAPKSLSVGELRELITNKTPVEVTLEQASEVQRWASGIPGWPVDGHKPLKFERRVDNGQGLRSRWSVALWATNEERAQIEQVARKAGESVAGLLLRLGTALAKRRQKREDEVFERENAPPIGSDDVEGAPDGDSETLPTPEDLPEG